MAALAAAEAGVATTSDQKNPLHFRRPSATRLDPEKAADLRVRTQVARENGRRNAAPVLWLDAEDRDLFGGGDGTDVVTAVVAGAVPRSGLQAEVWALLQQEVRVDTALSEWPGNLISNRNRMAMASTRPTSEWPPTY